jgi:molybdate transport system substrate-binding protein
MLVAALALMAACGGGQGAGDAGRPDELVVAAASDLRPVFDELARRHEDATEVRVVLVYGSSGLLARQALAGAPFEVFASADQVRAEEVASRRPGDGTTATAFATGRLVVLGLGPAATLEALNATTAGLIAIANPEHAPYGRAAEEALRATGVWAAVQDRLVLADNVADAARLYFAGEVDAAIVARSLVEPADLGAVASVAEELHAPIRQSLVVLVPAADGGPPSRRAALAFVDRVLGDEGRQLLEARGFIVPSAPDDGAPAAGGGW